jgi:4a-hydroxytetrahydrobiopterin dehydratase
MTKLTDEQVESSLLSLAGWTVATGKLHREYKFPDFVHAFGFMATCATAIEAMNHHPEWFNVWNRVVVDLSTHDAGGITEKDFQLARRMEGIAKKLQA